METQRQHIIENYIKAYNSFDTKGILTDLASTIVFNNFSNGELTLSLNGVDEFEKQAQLAATLFSERKQQIMELAQEGETIKAEIQYDAVLAQDLAETLKKGDSLSLKGKSVFHFNNDNQIVKIEDFS